MVTFVKLKNCIFNLFLGRVTFSFLVLFSWFNAKIHSPYLFLIFDIIMSMGRNKISNKLTNISVFKVREYKLFYFPALISIIRRNYGQLFGLLVFLECLQHVKSQWTTISRKLVWTCYYFLDIFLGGRDFKYIRHRPSYK